MSRADLFAAIKPFVPGGHFNDDHVKAIDALADMFGMPRDAPAGPACTGLTVRTVLEVAGHEAIVREAYKDGKGNWTWAMGVTNASGHEVYPRYKDSPQDLRHCIEVSVWLLRTAYLPQVLAAFEGHALSEAQVAAALSFHWNTGAIGKTDWVALFKAGNLAESRRFLENHYLDAGSLKDRRAKEAALFFDGAWSSDGKTTVYEVAKPSYSPNWSTARRVDVSADVAAVLAVPA